MLKPDEQTLIVTFTAFRDRVKDAAEPAVPLGLRLIRNPARLLRFLIKTKFLTDQVYKSPYFNGWVTSRITRVKSLRGTILLEYLDQDQLDALVRYVHKHLPRLNPPEYEETQLTMPLTYLFPSGELPV